ncbi:MAG: hypothetical protein A3F95_02190 [Candidatus Nealsonbacteria bacterium RIFCSPLOWO2_12_FULL_39_31]|uniref:Uncharacterized protein n=3 Tax=Candidatus Nealsoniibacteriota TaxID=1817911 RepID=A0A1G2ELW5_9BACT|nr:MAG: hypothetical protein A2626_00255 [Candidatus Nealsonbacteria bacterium RIFCSPHIGHO2_01_FULL_38_55]OGZ20943.1 MAG: hypothetical protein A3C48_03175 [Candidatus Nealsonbacteria bacterium RIFCSPHIGHO2_02_FULL_38_75]OGZ22856.1 MAG: hypothetical protein A3E18_00230 [Candidatus Nealsonbacteria bacterium RIFCSPHIGHO2_12_FULL_38_18]OGZ25313.1 MAG: hypothetical protein A3I85_02970 [Candidatus Nealsonbacteria bacterium RIFCSPLOWO2_02_FULL_38_63]OGZ26238.1 MAG: hypothetical protein A2W71_00320 [Ca
MTKRVIWKKKENIVSLMFVELTLSARKLKLRQFVNFIFVHNVTKFFNSNWACNYLTKKNLQS